MSLDLSPDPLSVCPSSAHLAQFGSLLKDYFRSEAMLSEAVWTRYNRARMKIDAEPAPAEDFRNDILAIADTQDRKAFARLFAHFAPRIKGFLIHRGSPSAVAEDLAQEALLSVWRKASYFDPSRAGASTWIFTIVRNMQTDGLRREKRAALHAAAEPEPQEPPMQPDAALDVSEKEVRVRQAMTELPKDQLDVVKLSFVDGKAHADIADTLNIPLGTVISRMRIAMIKLRGILEDFA